jgi:imidazoleglycerol-phosphate dehydratase
MSQWERVTRETRIRAAIELDGEGNSEIRTGIGLFAHMLVLLARHSLMELTVEAEGVLEVDAHHTVEDTVMCWAG